MNLTTENIYMLGICFAAVLFLFFNRLVKLVLRIFFRTAFGLAAIYFFNMLLCKFDGLKNFCPGINFVSAGVSAFLGAPGIILLYVLRIIV